MFLYQRVTRENGPSVTFAYKGLKPSKKEKLIAHFLLDAKNEKRKSDSHAQNSANLICVFHSSQLNRIFVVRSRGMVGCQ